MKKILTIILCVICLLGIVGCSKAEIKIKDGTKEQKSCSELYRLLANNRGYYKKHYGGAKIKVVGKVLRIENEKIMVLSGGCEVYFYKGTDVLSEILPGTKVEIEGIISSNPNFSPAIEEPSLKILS